MEEEKTGENKTPGSDPFFFVQEAESLREQKKYAEAIQTCQEGLRKVPEALAGRLILGKCYLESGRIPEARKELERVAQAVEECLPVYKLLAQVYLEEKNVDKALEALRKTLLFPGVEEGTAKKLTPLEKGLLHRGSHPPFSTPPAFQMEAPKEVTPGTKEFKTMPEEDPSIKAAIQTDTLAEIYIKQGHLDRALSVYQDILARDPQNAAAREKFDSLKDRIQKKEREETRQKVQGRLEKWLSVVSSRKMEP
ncbi:MAG: tetratricopeptide repeat protein [Syntrophaceae bacterium]|nr:tetratricopeptide repeat protein [Syntrophaceae bacterium]